MRHHTRIHALIVWTLLFGGAASPPTPRSAVVRLSLNDAMALAFENSDVVRTLDAGRVVVPPATSYDPAIVNEQTQAALAAFDTSFAANFGWNRYEGPPDTFFGPGLDRESRFDQATFASGLTKRWTPGTETRVFYNPSPGYLYYPNGTSGLNPSHVSALELSARQPLLRGAGVEVNLAPVRIAQLKTDQSAWEFKQELLAFARSVQQAYWEVQAARVAVQIIERQLPLLDEVVRVEQANVAAQRSVAADLAKARTQQRALRQELIDSRLKAQESELRLRNVLGLDRLDTRPLELSTPPTAAPIVVDPSEAVARALDLRPDLIWQRIRTRIDEVDLLVAENRYRPQFDVQALYRANGLQDDLLNALEMMGRHDYYDWEFGGSFTVPLGRNADRARLRAAQWQLQRDRALLRENVRLTEYRLGEIIVRIESLHQQYVEATARAQDAEQWLRGAEIRYKNPPPAGRDDNWLLVALNDYLLALRAAASAGTEAASLLARYNTELARLEEAQGTSLASFQIELHNDPCAGAVVRKLPKVELAAQVATDANVETAEARPVQVAAWEPRIERLPAVPPTAHIRSVRALHRPKYVPVIVRLPPPELGP